MKHKLFAIRFSDFYKEAKRCVKSKSCKATWTKTPQSQGLSESFCWQLSPVSSKTQLLSPVVHLDLFLPPRLRQGTRSARLQDGSVMGGHLASGCAAREWHEMNLQRALWILCPLSSQWEQPLRSLVLDNDTMGWLAHTDILCHAWLF